MLTRKSSARLVLLCVLAAFVFSFASLPGCIYVNAETEKPYGFSGNIILGDDLDILEYDAIDFSGVDVGANFEVHITPGDEYSVVIDAHEKTHEIIHAKVKNNILDLGFSRSVRNPGTVRARIVMPTLEYLAVSGAAEVDVDRGFEVDSLHLDGSGAAEVRIDIAAKKMVADLSGAAEIEIAGRADALKLDGSGAAEFYAEDLILIDADIDLSGASSARVDVRNDLTLDLSGASNVNCEREPAKIYSETSGVSDIDC